jgi:hypothetical protein
MPGFTFSDVYHMPVHLRNFYFRQYTELKKKEDEQINKAQSTKQPTIPRRFNPK